MGYQTSTQEDMQKTGSSYLDEPGWYMVLCTGIHSECYSKKNGDVIPFDGYQVFGEVQRPVEQQGKSLEMIFWPPKGESQKGDEWSVKKITAGLAALGQLHPAKVGQECEIVEDNAIGRLFVVHVEKDQNDRYLQLAYCDIFHIDDPRAAKHIDADVLAGYPADRRLQAKDFDPILPASLRSDKKKKAGSNVATEKPKPAAESVDVDALI